MKKIKVPINKNQMPKFGIFFTWWQQVQPLPNSVVEIALHWRFFSYPNAKIWLWHSIGDAPMVNFVVG